MAKKNNDDMRFAASVNWKGLAKFLRVPEEQVRDLKLPPQEINSVKYKVSDVSKMLTESRSVLQVREKYEILGSKCWKAIAKKLHPAFLALSDAVTGKPQGHPSLSACDVMFIASFEALVRFVDADHAFDVRDFNTNSYNRWVQNEIVELYAWWTDFRQHGLDSARDDEMYQRLILIRKELYV